MSKAIVIGSPAALTINESGRFKVSEIKAITDAGKVSSGKVTIEVEGDITSDVVDETAALSAAVIEQFAAQRVQIQENGTPIDGWDWQPADVLWGPFITEFETFDDPGAGESHWRYRLKIELETPGNMTGGGGEPVKNLKTSIETIKVNGETRKVIWEAECKAKDVDVAEDEVRAFAPSDENITESIKTFREQASARGVWVWEAQKKKGGILSVECIVDVTDSEVDYAVDPQAGGPPLFHELLEGPIAVDIDVTIRGFSDKLKPYPEHCKADGKSIVRIPGRFNPTPTARSTEDAKAGIYTLHYTERYLGSGVTPAIKHADNHHLISFSEPPSNGNLES